MKNMRIFATLVLIICVSNDLSSNEQYYQLLRDEEIPNGSFGCDTPPYEKGHACNPVWTKYDEARIRKMFRLQLAFCDKQHLPIILDMIDRMEKRLREEGFNRPLCD